MPGKAACVIISEKHNDILQEFLRATTVSVRLQQRANIILLAFEKKLNQDIARRVGLSRVHVGKWRTRWKASFDALISVECNETYAELRRTIQDVLSDAPRSGAPVTFTPEQVTQVLAVPCESPELSHRPIDFWTAREIADEVTLRKIVTSISTSHVGRLLRSAMLQPHRNQYWLNTTEKDPLLFQQQVENVCQTYLDAPKLNIESNTHTVCVDEMSGVQALERDAPTISMQPGTPERIEANYTRHGTQCLIGNWDVVEGQMISPTVGDTRTEADFVAHIDRLVSSDASSKWVLVMDNLNTHQSESMVNLVARDEGIEESTLGKKGRSGVQKSMATRQEFLSDASHRIRIVFTPKHASWLNQIEVIFGIIARRIIRRGNFKSTAALRDRILAFIEYYNTTFAKSFRWTFTGRPVATKTDKRPRTWKEDWVDQVSVGKLRRSCSATCGLRQ